MAWISGSFDELSLMRLIDLMRCFEGTCTGPLRQGWRREPALALTGRSQQLVSSALVLGLDIGRALGLYSPALSSAPQMVAAFGSSSLSVFANCSLWMSHISAGSSVARSIPSEKRPI